MALPSYAEVATRLGVTICRGVLPTGGYCPLTKGDHVKGKVSPGRVTVVHWADRRPTYGGIRDFVMLIATVQLVMGAATDRTPPWQTLYLQLKLAKELLVKARLRPRSDVWAEDMARLHAMAIAAPRSPERDRAVRWSQGH